MTLQRLPHRARKKPQNSVEPFVIVTLAVLIVVALLIAAARAGLLCDPADLDYCHPTNPTQTETVKAMK